MARMRTWQLVALVVLAATAGLPATAAPAAASTTTYTVTDMGSLGGLGVTSTGINANGQVTGSSYLSKTYPVKCSPDYPNPNKCVEHPYHAFLYSNGKMTDLGTVGGGNNSQGNAINLSGQVAGWSETSSNGSIAVVWNGNKAVNLGALAPLAGSGSAAYGINDAGQVVGTWESNNTAQPFLYSNGTIIGLPDPFTGGEGCQPLAINNNGQIAGVCYDANRNSYLMLWANGTVSDLGTLSTGAIAVVIALSMNNNSQIAGWFGSGNGGNQGFLYNNGTLTLQSSFLPEAINDNGVIVGGPDIDNGGTLQNLNTLIPAGYSNIDATAINDNGQIVATASGTPSGDDGVVLNPT